MKQFIKILIDKLKNVFCKKTIYINRLERKKMPDERMAITTKLSVGRQELYLTEGLNEDGTLGEIFICINKEGGEMRIYDSFAIAISIALQYGIPLSVFADKYINQSFEPSGITNCKQYPLVKSIPDLIFRILKDKYINEGDETK
jgi:ribonucleoside-diphosphate reductase alpha chain